jgi:hypothetical protein
MYGIGCEMDCIVEKKVKMFIKTWYLKRRWTYFGLGPIRKIEVVRHGAGGLEQGDGKTLNTKDTKGEGRGRLEE